MPIEEELKTYLQVLWRYKWMIAACAIISTAVALGISLQLTPTYSATATVRVASAPGGASDYTYISSATRLTNTYVEIATSDISLDQVAERLGLEKQPIVDVGVVPETELIQIEASDPVPAMARDIANTLASLMVEQSLELYGGDAPSARELLEGQLKQAKADLDSAVSDYDHALRVASASATPSVNGTPLPNPDVEVLGNIVRVRQDIYADLLQKYESARTNEQLRTNAITIVQPAYLPEKPASPKIPLNMALGLAAGLAAGVILAFLFEGMDNTLRGIEDVKAMTSLPILSMVPEVNHRFSPNVNLGFSRDGHFSPILAFDQLRARLILLSAKPKSNTFLITSPEPGAGKSTIATNLAVSLAQGGSKVVLIDMDFRRPRVHSILGLPNEKGLSHYLRGEVELDTVLQMTSIPDLHVIVAGSSPHVPSEWTTPVRIGSLFKMLSKEYNYVLIDTPALLSVADPTLLASQVDGVILVVARRKTERQNFSIVLQQFSELKTKLVGIVVNMLPNSQLYSYYSDHHARRFPKRLSFWQGKTANRTTAVVPNNHSGEDGE